MNTLKRDLHVMMRGLAAQDFQRRHPHATEHAAWTWGERNYRRFRDPAISFLTMVVLEEETAAAARARPN